jgi:catechol 2,3-dioxygenase-like lactoylglutathione lyase family enzyme
MTVEEMTGLLNVCTEAMARGSTARDRDVLDQLGVFGKEGGAGIRTAAAAIYLASRYVAKPSAGLLAAAFAKRADTDTIACVTGSILGPFTEGDRVGGLADNLQDAPYIHQLARDVAIHEGHAGKPEQWRAERKRELITQLRTLGPGDSLTLPIFGVSEVCSLDHPETKSKNSISVWWLSTEIGQSLSIADIAKQRSDDSSPKGSQAPSKSEAGQIALKDLGPQGAEAPQTTWTFLFVDDVAEAVHFYTEIIGLPLRKNIDYLAVVGNNLVLEKSAFPEAKQNGASVSQELRAAQVIGIRVSERRLRSTHEQATAHGYRSTPIKMGRHGERFRVADRDGHVVEVWTQARQRPNKDEAGA